MHHFQVIFQSCIENLEIGLESKVPVNVGHERLKVYVEKYREEASSIFRSHKAIERFINFNTRK